MSFDHLLRFTPLYQTRVWGGRRLDTLLHRSLPDAQPYGEAWELVDREQEQSVVAAGAQAGMSLHELWTQHRAAVFGQAYAAHPSPRFPLLIKVLDCCDDLSLQVHPPASIAPELKGEPKTEMWYVAHADAGASLYAGVKAGVNRNVFEQALKEGTAAQCVPVLPAQTGDSLFVPSGRLHALGGGLLIYEIQQNSDTTYRVFDWNRVGLDGKPRELHVEQSLKCIDFTDVDPVLDRGHSVLAECEHFRVSRVKTGHVVPADRFRLIMPIMDVQWAGETLVPGDLALLPASAVKAEPAGEWLEIEMPA
jgi:mannose-6-phosphate isomerase